MSTTIQIRRGLKINLPTLEEGELAYTVDENLVYVGDGSHNYCVGNVASGVGNPSGNLVAGRVYVNTASGTIFFCNGSEWVGIGGSVGTLDDIQDGINYQRVAASEVDSSGYVIQINDGTHSVTAEQSRDHIDNATIHRSINDSGSSNIDLWSAQRIMDQLGIAIRGIDWQSSVLTISGSPPVGPAEGERYIISVGATGGWTTYDNYISEWTVASGTWVMTQPNEGFAAWVEDVDKLYLYTGNTWTPMSSVTHHNYLSGLDGGSEGSYYHLSPADFAALTTNRADTVKAIVGPMASGTQTSISVDYNEPLGVFDFVVSVAHSATTGQTADDHHAEQHALTSSTVHTVTTVSGYVLRATGTNTFDFGPLISTDLPLHASRHQHGGDDEVATATPAANAIPKSTAGADLNNWITLLDGGSFV